MPKLLRYQQFLAYAFGFLAIWSKAVQNQEEIIDKLPHSCCPTNAKLYKLAIDYAPIWAILALGIWAASSVVYGVLLFRSCPEAAMELDGQVKEAKAELSRRGLDKLGK
mmetsp:Transcript_16322/g.24061  ORF Transcript_16322/g.24061 Transcript_16322/m.24061 type:complete len:109 (-) Transcript_16322:249-575(-)